MRELALKIEQAYNAQVIRIINKQKVWICETNKGSVVIKAYASMEKALWVTHLADSLFSRGYREVVQYIRAYDGSPFFAWNGSYFTVMKKIEGRCSSYFNRDDIKRAARSLALFHTFSQNIVPGPLATSPVPPLLFKWSTRMKRFYEMVTNAAPISPNPRLDALIRWAAPSILEEAHRAMTALQRSELSKEYTKSLESFFVSHRDLASHNFIITRSHTAALIDFDTAAYDTPIVDIAQFISRVLVQQEWNPAVFHMIMATYENIRPLTRQDLSLIFLLLRFPDNFLREVIGLYDHKRGFQADRIEFFLSMLIRQTRKREHFFASYHHLIG
nr:phosphotransferase [Aneurinibacillus terranovensis]